MVKGSQELIHRRYHPQSIIQNDSDLEVTEADHKNLLRELCETNPPDDLAAIRRAKRQIKGTCEWLLLRKEYTTWVGSDRSQLLRLEGGPGIGKTVIASFLVGELDKRAQTNPRMTFAYYFCDEKNGKRRKATSILRALILQLLRQHKLFQYIEPTFDKWGVELFDDVDTLWQILLDISRDPKSGDVFFLIDALDECEKPSREFLLRNFKELLASSELSNQTRISGKFKILITCRHDKDIIRELGNISTYLHVDAGKVNADLRKFIAIKVTETSGLNRWTPNLKNTVQEALIKKAGGTFLWASLVLKELEKTDKDQVRGKLNDFPDDLYDLYDRILSGIERMDEAQLILQLMVAARRPLTQRELGMAYVLKRGRDEDILALEDQLDESENIFAVCKQMVYLDEHNKTVNFIHQSAKDYLLSNHLQESEKLKQYYVAQAKANLLIFQICWRYFSMKEFDQGNKIISRSADDGLLREDPSEEYLQGYCFLEYARQEWQEHALAASSAFVTDYEFKKGNLDKMPTLRDTWLLRAAAEGQEVLVGLLLENGAELESKDSHGLTLLSWTAANGHEAIVKLLLEKGAELESKDIDGRTPLSWTAGSGHEAVVKLLLEKGAELESKDTKYGRTPLSWAAEDGNEAAVKLLLENGANVESKDTGFGWTPLLWAAENGNEVAVTLLLKKGANVESKDTKVGRTPLSRAAEGGHEAVAKLLLENGANVESKDTEFGQTPLSWAAEDGHEAVVKLLLEKGADLESKDSSYGQTPLLWAAENGHAAVVKLLLENGANMESKDTEFDWTPLSWAAQDRHEAVVKLLLEKGADIETKDIEFGRTPLSWAAGNRLEAAVKLLLENGANVESKDTGFGWTPLLWAAEDGNEAVVKLLLEKGAELESKDIDGRTPLSWTAGNGYEAVVKLLLEKGADIESRDTGSGWTPLRWAADGGHEAVMKLLLKKGANVESTDTDFGWTPLLWAAEDGNEAVVKLLLENGANVEPKDTRLGRTPLSWAAANGHEAVVKLLLENGADIESKDTVSGWTPLWWAAKGRHKAVMKLLLKKGAKKHLD
jgi:ankyrin repeat protein